MYILTIDVRGKLIILDIILISRNKEFSFINELLIFLIHSPITVHMYSNLYHFEIIKFYFDQINLYNL
jgi:hypothetical protein